MMAESISSFLNTGVFDHKCDEKLWVLIDNAGTVFRDTEENRKKIEHIVIESVACSICKITPFDRVELIET